MRIAIDLFLLIGAFFAFAGVVGLFRMPDSFCRMQSSTNIPTLGMLGVAIGTFIYALVYAQNGGMAVKILAIAVFTLLTNPVSGHAIAKAGYKHGVHTEMEMVCDEYGRDISDE